MNEIIILGNNKIDFAVNAPVLTRESIQAVPVEQIVKAFGVDYFSTPESYLLAYAIFLGFKKIRLQGVEIEKGEDFNRNKAGMTFWIGIANGRGIEVEIDPKSQLYRIMKENVKDRYKEARRHYKPEPGSPEEDEMNRVAAEGKDPYVFVSGIDPSAITFTTRDKDGKELSRWWS
jgi:hypothetical protein